MKPEKMQRTSIILSEKLIKEAKENGNNMTDKKTMLAYSGGKDSTALLYLLNEKDMLPDKIVFADTQCEFPEMYEYLDKVEKYFNINIIKTLPKYTWEDFFYMKNVRGKHIGKIHGFPTASRGCSFKQYAKIYPMRDIEKLVDIVYIGLTYGEEKRINKNKPSAKYPLIDWKYTDEMCLQLTKDIGLYNSLYNNFSRIGCIYCPKKRLYELQNIMNLYPEEWEKIKKYEKDSPFGYRTDYTCDQLEERFKIKDYVKNFNMRR